MRIHEFRWRRQSSSVSWRSRPLARHSSMKPAKSSPSFVSVTPWFFIRAWRQGSERNSSAVSASTLPYRAPPFPELSRTCAPPPSSSVSSFLFFFSSFSLVLSLSSFLRFVSSLRLRGGSAPPESTGGRAAAAGGVWGADVLPSPLRGCAQSVSRITLSPPSVSAPSEMQKRP